VKEIVMSRHYGYSTSSPRKVFERIFAGAVFIGTVAFVVGGSIAMCLPSATFVA
jgi:hypothetical protein